MSEVGDGLHLRRATDEDGPAVLGLLGSALGWGDDRRFAAFFAWKHRDNPAGASPAWVALDGDRIVGLRTFLRWELEGPDGAVRAVRAVDTATHPEYQRRGIFSRLTRLALEELVAEGVQVVFNTPNDRSGPGYLKLGWQKLGRLPVRFRPTSAGALIRLAGARCPAERWSLPLEAGHPATEVLAGPEIAGLLGARGTAKAWRTRRSAAFVAWRYGFEPLHYRAVLVGRDVADGVAVFRARRRGSSVEGTVCDVVVAGDDPRLRRAALARVAAVAGIDYVLTLDRPGLTLPLPGQGPTLFARELTAAAVPPASGWQLSLGDVELF